MLDLGREYYHAIELPYGRRARPRWARLESEGPQFPPVRRLTAAEKKGLLYERRVQLELSERHGASYLEGPWFHWGDERGGSHWCQPDGLLVNLDQGRLTVCEIKWSHSERGFNQLWNLYLPVVDKAFNMYRPALKSALEPSDFDPADQMSEDHAPPWDIVACEVTRFADGGIVLPKEKKIVRDLEKCEIEVHNICVFNPKKMME